MRPWTLRMIDGVRVWSRCVPAAPPVPGPQAGAPFRMTPDEVLAGPPDELQVEVERTRFAPTAAAVAIGLLVWPVAMVSVVIAVLLALAAAWACAVALVGRLRVAVGPDGFRIGANWIGPPTLRRSQPGRPIAARIARYTYLTPWGRADEARLMARTSRGERHLLITREPVVAALTVVIAQYLTTGSDR